jgi:hypothetical protein
MKRSSVRTIAIHIPRFDSLHPLLDQLQKFLQYFHSHNHESPIFLRHLINSPWRQQLTEKKPLYGRPMRPAAAYIKEYSRWVSCEQALRPVTSLWRGSPPPPTFVCLCQILFLLSTYLLFSSSSFTLFTFISRFWRCFSPNSWDP